LEYVALDQTEKEVIDAHLFVEALAMICLDIAPPECSFPEAVNSNDSSSSSVCKEWTLRLVHPLFKKNSVLQGKIQ
jgi:hypothetical protein